MTVCDSLTISNLLINLAKCSDSRDVITLGTTFNQVVTKDDRDSEEFLLHVKSNEGASQYISLSCHRTDLSLDATTRKGQNEVMD